MGDTNVVPVRVQNVLDMELMRLNLWSIQFTAGSIKLEGFVRNEDGTMMRKVCSEAICRRMTATMLFDISGCFFELAGQIDREYQHKMGMPNRVIDEFINGFPENWAFLIKSCLSSEQRSAVRPIQAAPREPLRRREEEPIVTLADETELVGGNRTTSETDNEKLRKAREEQLEKEKEQEKRLKAEKEKQRLEEIAAAAAIAAEKKRKEEEEAANSTLRVPQSQNGEPITPIRFTRGNGQKGTNSRPIFEKTPVRGKSAGPMASSTPQLPPQETRRLSHSENKVPSAPSSPKRLPPNPEPNRMNQYADDAELFAVPKLPSAYKSTRPSAASRPGLDFLDDTEALFNEAVINKTPSRDRQPRRGGTSMSPERRRRSPSRDRDREFNDFETSRHTQRYNDYDNMSRMSRRDTTISSRRNDTRRDESRMSRKRGHDYSPDDFGYGRRRDDRDMRPDYYPPDSRYDSKRSRQRETSSSSGRSVRFEEDYQRRRGDSRGEWRDRRGERGYDHHRRPREMPGDCEEDKMRLKDILRREKELMSRLQTNQKPSSSRRQAFSSDDEMDEWDRENQEILDNSMMFGDGVSKKKESRGAPSKKNTKQTTQKKPARKPAPPRKKQREPSESEDLNDSIASNRPRRSCVTPSTPAPKRITWPKKDLDRLKHVIGLKKPTGSDADWTEVTRLLAKEGVEPDVVKQTAITKLKWKEPVQQDEEQNQKEEEEEKRRRRGAAGRVKEGVRMHEELRQGGNKRADDLQIESMEDYQPDDVAADQSLLALRTPIVAKQRGGTRASILPQPVEDSPIIRGVNSTVNSPRLDQTKAKDVETTLKYVQHLSMMQARPSSRANTSSSNKSSTRGSKNTSLSLEQGTRKALKMINRARVIHEDDEEDDDDDDENGEEEDLYGDNSNY